MGVYAAQNMCNCADNYGTEMKFELFTHITRFFGYKVRTMLCVLYRRYWSFQPYRCLDKCLLGSFTIYHIVNTTYVCFPGQVVMLGRFNAQGLGQETEALTRTLEVNAQGLGQETEALTRTLEVTAGGVL